MAFGHGIAMTFHDSFMIYLALRQSLLSLAQLTRIIHGSIRKRRNLFFFRWLRESPKKQCANQPVRASVRFSRNRGLAPSG